jgi:hypothetical protein
VSTHKNGYSRSVCIFLILGVGILVWITTPTQLEFGNHALSDLPTMFGYLVMISLFVERTIEVFLSAWRSQGADELDLKIATIQKKIIKADKDQENPDSVKNSLDFINQEFEKLQEKRAIYSAESRSLAHWFGLGIGVMVSLVGVREGTRKFGG